LKAGGCGKKDSAEWKTAAAQTLSAQRRVPVAEAAAALITAQNAADDVRQKLAATTQPVAKAGGG